MNSNAVGTMSAHEAVDQGMNILDLPAPCLVHLIQYVASGPGGLASAASLSQSCKRFHTLSDSSVVIYCNLHLDQAISSPDHPVWSWVTKRQGRISGVSVTVDFGETRQGTCTIGHPEWKPPLGALTNIDNAHLTVRLGIDTFRQQDYHLVAQWLKQHGGNIVDCLDAAVWSTYGAEVQELCEAVAPCRYVGLYMSHRTVSFNLGALADLAGTPVQLTVTRDGFSANGRLTGFSAFTSLAQLTRLCIFDEHFVDEDAWVHLAGLSSLQDLSLQVDASGDPSPLSALTRLSSLHLCSRKSFTEEDEEDEDEDDEYDHHPHLIHHIFFSFSSLQPLSTLQHLEVLRREGYSCSATSLQGLAGLSMLRKLTVMYADQLASVAGLSSSVTFLSLGGLPKLASLAGSEGCSSLNELRIYSCPLTSLESLRGSLSTCLQSLQIWVCRELQLMSGVEGLQALQELKIESCGVTSLRALANVTTGLKKLVIDCCRHVQDEVLELPHMQPTSDVKIDECGNVREVVLAGGIRRECRVSRTR